MASQQVGSRRCDGVTRRDWLRVGALTAMGLTLPVWFQRRAALAAAGLDQPGRARQCILIWLDGGPSHLETFDPKPDAPAEVRGPLDTIETAVSGIRISELLPGLAQRMEQVAIIRSMTSPLGEHNLGTHYLLTGYKPTPALDYPSLGAIGAHLRGTGTALPPFIAIPDHRVGGGKFVANGFLPMDCAPFEVGGDPAKPGFRVRDLSLWPGMTLERIERRRAFLKSLDHWQQTVESADASVDPAFEQAYRLVTSPDVKRAFDLEDEPRNVRERYGWRTVGQSCLLARRLVERGVPFVTVNQQGWDTHENLYTRLKEGYTGAKTPVGLIPSLDLALSALIDDLQQRGLLDETLILVMGEFGRTPKLNQAGGRDHWPRVFSVAMAGGGIRGGQVVGSSDRTGESPHDRAVTPADLLATVYRLLGIPTDRLLYTSDGRPIPINTDGKVVTELIA